MTDVVTGVSETTAGQVDLIDVVLTIFVLITVIVITTVSSRRTQVGAYLSLGAVLSAVWLRLGSVDVSLAEAALGGGVLSGILVWLVVADPTAPAHSVDEKGPRAPRWIKAATGLFGGAVIAVVLGSVVLRTRHVPAGWSQGLSEEMAGTGVEHEITAVLLAFRAYDTLLESAVLLFAGVVAIALCADFASGTRQIPVPSIFRWFVRVAAPVVLMLGLWLLFAGGSDSGGAFQSGSVLAGLLILLRLAGIRLPLVHRLLVPLLILGVLFFIGMGLVGPLVGQPWLAWIEEQSFLMIFLIEVFLTIGITAGLYLLYLALENPGHRITAGGEAAA